METNIYRYHFQYIYTVTTVHTNWQNIGTFVVQHVKYKPSHLHKPKFQWFGLGKSCTPTRAYMTQGQCI
jgi:hypothetical protein